MNKNAQLKLDLELSATAYSVDAYLCCKGIDGYAHVADRPICTPPKSQLLYVLCEDVHPICW